MNHRTPKVPRLVVSLQIAGGPEQSLELAKGLLKSGPDIWLYFLRRAAMMYSVTKSSRPPEPFPWLCSRCGEPSVAPVSIDYVAAMKYEGREYEFEVPALRVLECGRCAQRLFDVDADVKISAAVRGKLGLLQGEQIRAGRESLGLTQHELAAHLGVAEESLARWEAETAIQSRVVDRQIRLYFQLPAVRTLLAADVPNFGTAVVGK